MFQDAMTIVAIFRKKTEEWYSCFPEESNIDATCNLIGKIINLHYRNFYQWIKEEIAHKGECDEHTLAQLKREIDASNLRRSKLIDEIDVYFVSRLGITKHDDLSNLYINSQTLGEIIDKLSILSLKQFFIELELERIALQSRKEYVQRIARINELLKYVAACFDRFLKFLKEGQAYLPYGQFKTYDVLNDQLDSDKKANYEPEV